MKWEEKTSAPVACYGHSAVQLGKVIYVGCGDAHCIGNPSFEIHCYNIDEDSWSSPMSIDRSWFAMTSLNGDLLIVGGNISSNRVTDQVSKMNADGQLEFYTKMNTARSKTTAASHNEMLIIAGGVDINRKVISSTELFDSKNGNWYTCSDISEPHCILKSVIVGNDIYLLGGLNKNGKCSPTVFAASLDTLSSFELRWDTRKATPYVCSDPVCVNGTDLLLLGGSEEGHGKYTSDVYRLDVYLGTKIWVKIGHLPFVRNLLAACAVSSDDCSVIVIGGTKVNGKPMNTMWKGSYRRPQ